jgi:hypothetical protein
MGQAASNPTYNGPSRPRKRHNPYPGLPDPGMAEEFTDEELEAQHRQDPNPYVDPDIHDPFSRYV